MGVPHKDCRRKSRPHLGESQENPPTKNKGKVTYTPTPLLLSPLEEKYSGPIKLAEEKLVDLQSLRNYISSNAGKAWVDELVVQQLSAHLVENVNDVHEQTTPENMADDDSLDDDSVPQPIVD